MTTFWTEADLLDGTCNQAWRIFNTCHYQLDLKVLPAAVGLFDASETRLDTCESDSSIQLKTEDWLSLMAGHVYFRVVNKQRLSDL